MLALAVEFEAEVVGLCVRDAIPASVEDRLEAASALVDLADAAGVPRGRLYIDPVLLAITSFQEDPARVLGFLEVLLDLLQPPVRTMVALSNLTYGLPSRHRTTVQSAFVAMAAAHGLDGVMLNARDERLWGVVRAVQAIRGERVFAPADLG